jgi:hypothetical protein
MAEDLERLLQAMFDDGKLNTLHALMCDQHKVVDTAHSPNYPKGVALWDS